MNDGCQGGRAINVDIDNFLDSEMVISVNFAQISVLQPRHGERLSGDVAGTSVHAFFYKKR